MKSSIDRVLPRNQEQRQRLDKHLTTYLASAGRVSAGLAGVAISASEAGAAVVGSGPLNVPFGPANGGPGNVDIPIDLDSDGELDFLLRHQTNSANEDYLELDKSPTDSSDFPDNNLDGNNNDFEYLVDTLGDYPVALPFGTLGGTKFTPPAGLQYEFWQDGTDYNSDFVDPKFIRRANRLIDYDSGVDEFQDANNIWDPPPSSPGNFVGLGGVPHYVGFQIDFDDAGPLHYGWIGVQITDDATASGKLIGYAYETSPLTPVTMGVIPEPGTMALAALGGITLTGSWITRRFFRK